MSGMAFIVSGAREGQFSERVAAGLDGKRPSRATICRGGPQRSASQDHRHAESSQECASQRSGKA